jgi:hypothetical protein
MEDESVFYEDRVRVKLTKAERKVLKLAWEWAQLMRQGTCSDCHRMGGMDEQRCILATVNPTGYICTNCGNTLTDAQYRHIRYVYLVHFGRKISGAYEGFKEVFGAEENPEEDNAPPARSKTRSKAVLKDGDNPRPARRPARNLATRPAKATRAPRKVRARTGRRD